MRKRNKMVGIHFTDDEYERVRQLAFAARKSVAAFVRDLVLAMKSKATK